MPLQRRYGQSPQRQSPGCSVTLLTLLELQRFRCSCERNLGRGVLVRAGNHPQSLCCYRCHQKARSCDQFQTAAPADHTLWAYAVQVCIVATHCLAGSFQASCSSHVRSCQEQQQRHSNSYPVVRDPSGPGAVWKGARYCLPGSAIGQQAVQDGPKAAKQQRNSWKAGRLACHSGRLR